MKEPKRYEMNRKIWKEQKLETFQKNDENTILRKPYLLKTFPNLCQQRKKKDTTKSTGEKRPRGRPRKDRAPNKKVVTTDDDDDDEEVEDESQIDVGGIPPRERTTPRRLAANAALRNMAMTASGSKDDENGSNTP